jgi:mono/diheme cytochrome c family protein
MSGRLTSTSLFLLLGLGAGASGCNEDLLNPMADRQPKVVAYATNETFEDGLSMRAPPAGTVPRERIVNNPAVTAGRPPGAAPESNTYVTSIPIPVDAALMKLGQKRYNIFCSTCHGPAGDGNSIVGTQMALRPPPSLVPYADRPPGYIFEVITNGFGMMASYAAELPVRDRWAVVAYVRALQISQTASIDKAPAEERARLMAEPATQGASPPAGGQPTHGAPQGAPAAPGSVHKEAP